MPKHHTLEPYRRQLVARLARDDGAPAIKALKSWLADKGVPSTERGLRAFRDRHQFEIAALRTAAIARATEEAGLTHRGSHWRPF